MKHFLISYAYIGEFVYLSGICNLLEPSLSWCASGLQQYVLLCKRFRSIV